MRRSALMIAPLFVLVLVTGCDGSSDQTPCVVGTWEVDEERFVEELGADLPAGSDLGLDGSLDFVLDEDGGFEWSWDVTISHSFPGSAGEVQQIIDTALRGAWSGPDNDIELTFTDIDGTVTSAENGEPIETTDAADIGTEGPWLATCSGSTMTIFGNGDPLRLVRKQV